MSDYERTRKAAWVFEQWNLEENQKLQIPAALGMSWSPTNTNLCQTNDTLYSRFWKVSSISYSGIKSLMKMTSSVSTIREVIDNLEMVTPVSERPTSRWETTEPDSDDTFGNLSKILEFNCDIRDFGYLLTENATVTDIALSDNVENVSRARLENKLKPYTLRMIAALNYGSVGNNPLGGWIRAYGLGVGIYHARDSVFKVEAVYTTKMPSSDDETVAISYEKDCGSPLMCLCLSFLALFGLVHFSQDNGGDEYMKQIVNSYLEALMCPGAARVMLSTKFKECVLVIAPHPFGFAQTCWLAKVMHKHRLLMPFRRLGFITKLLHGLDE